MQSTEPTVEALPGEVVMEEGRCHPHDAQHEQRQQQQQYHRLVHPAHDSLQQETTHQQRRPSQRELHPMVGRAAVFKVSLNRVTFLDPANPSDSVKK